MTEAEFKARLDRAFFIFDRATTDAERGAKLGGGSLVAVSLAHAQEIRAVLREARERVTGEQGDAD